MLFTTAARARVPGLDIDFLLRGESDWVSRDFWRLALEIDLALLEGLDAEQLKSKLRGLEELGRKIQDSDAEFKLSSLRLRLHLLDSANGDPCAATHPGLQEVRRRFSGGSDSKPGTKSTCCWSIFGSHVCAIIASETRRRCFLCKASED